MGLNERRATPTGSIWQAIRRGEAVFSPARVAAHLCTANTRRSLRCEGVRQYSRGSALGVHLSVRKNSRRRYNLNLGQQTLKAGL